MDKYNRITGAIALVSKNTIPRITEKELEYPRPYGWTKNLEKTKRVFESCHIIAYNIANTRKGYQLICKTDWLKFAINIKRLRKRGLVFLLDQYTKVHIEYTY